MTKLNLTTRRMNLQFFVWNLTANEGVTILNTPDNRQVIKNNILIFQLDVGLKGMYKRNNAEILN